jgi:hypothetical protein
MLVLVAEGHCEAPVLNPGPKIEIPHPENHVLKVFRCENPSRKVEITSPENHVLKIIS